MAVFKPHHRSKPKRALPQRLVQGVILLTAAILAGTAGLTAALTVPLPRTLRDQGPRSLGDLWDSGLGYHVSRPVNVLVMGIDRVPGAAPGSKEMFTGRSDSMLLVRVDPDANTLSLLSIPRDTQVNIPGVGLTKINDANVEGGAKLAAKTVSANLNGVKVDRYVRFSTDAFRELIDLLGGVEVYVPERMQYEDKTQKLKIDLQVGQQRLNGEQAEQFARFRSDGFGDIGRVQRQQSLLKAVRQKLLNPLMIPRIPALLQDMRKYVDTNLTNEEMLALVGTGRRLSQNLKMVMLPGRFSAVGEFKASYWLMDLAGRDRILEQYFSIDPENPKSDTQRLATELRISLQNASNQSTAAEKLRQRLATLGFTNVTIIDDWADKQRKTEIIVQQGDLKSATDVRDMLQFGAIEAASTGDIESDLTIRIGDDWMRYVEDGGL
jgi:polyisoprenyl-teichoic acid--peptidoglycan teichoic acid transferase